MRLQTRRPLLTPGVEGLLYISGLRRFEIAVDQTGPPVPGDVHLEDRRRVAGELDLHIYGVVPYFVSEHRVLHHGVERVVRRVAVLEGDRLIGVEQDLTEQRDLERRCRESELAFAQLVESLPVAAVVVRDGRVVCANPAARTLLTGAEGFLHHPVLSWIAPEDTAQFCALLAEAELGRAPIRVRFETADRVFPVFATAEAVRWQGAAAQLVRFAEDGGQLAAPARAVVGPPAGALPLHPAIGRDDDRAQEAERLASLGALAAAVAHEVNNPLSAMALQLEYVEAGLEALAGRSSSAQALLPALRDAIEAARRVRDVILDLRAFSGARASRPHPVDLERVVALAANLSRHEVRHSAEVSVELGDHGPVVADEGRLSQAILQVLVDAARAVALVDGPRGQILITSVLEDDEVVLSIRDDGPAPTREQLAQMFEPSGTTRAGGFGLSLARSAIVQLGGSMSARRLHPTGCEVRIRLPCADCQVDAERLSETCSMPVYRLDPDGDALFDALAAATASPPVVPSLPELTVVPPALLEPAPARTEEHAEVSPPKPAWAEPKNTLQRVGRVLLADDEPAIARGVSAALRRTHEVVSCGDGIEAIAALEQGEFDLILCDLMMPGLGGDGVFAWIQTHRPELADRFVIITGGAVTAATSAFIESGQCRVLHKPFEARALRALLTPLPRASGRFDATGALADRERYAGAQPIVQQRAGQGVDGGGVRS